MQLPLNETAPVVLDGSGNGTVRLGPDGPHEHWYPTLVSVKCSTSAAEAGCKIYAGPAATDANFVAGTLSGSTGDASDQVAGQEIAKTRTPYLWAVWEGGDPGATATLNVQGTKDLG